MKEQTVYVCDYCGCHHETKEAAINCEKMGQDLNTLRFTLQLLPINDRPYPWVEIYNKKTEENILVYPKNITFGNVGETTCLHKNINITTLNNDTYKIDKFSDYEFVGIHAIEKIYRERNLLPDASFIECVLNINISPFSYF